MYVGTNARRNAPRRRFHDPSIRRYERQTNTFVTAKDETEERNEPERRPSSKTRACTNDDENVTARQKTRERTVGNGEQRRQGRREGHSWQSTNENKERGNGGGSDIEDEDAGFEVRQLPVRKHEVEETNLE